VKSRSLVSVFVALALPLSLAPRPVCAAPPPDAEVAAAEEEQNRQLAAARHGGSMAGVVTQAQSRHLRNPSALNLFLLGRAQFHAGDRPAAERSMRDVVAQEPSFWQAHARLGMLAVEAGDLPRAQQHLELLARLKPTDVEVLRLQVAVSVRGKDWAKALAALRGLLALTPDSIPIKMGIAEMLASLGDWKAAYADLRPLRVAMGRDPRVRLAYARAAFKVEKLDEAAAELEALLKEDPQAVQVLDLLRQVYMAQRDAPKLAGVLERLRPFAKPEDHAKIDETIAAQVAPQGPADPLVALINRSMSPDVATRREALQQLHEANLGVLPNALVMHYHPQEEPDPVCRAWVLRLVAQLGNDMTVRIPGHALQDPDSLVRRVGAESLGELATPAGLMYLVPLLSDLNLTADAPVATVEEYNAGRAALVRITGHDDLPADATERWVGAAGLEASWKAWEAWLDTPAGVEMKLKAIDDLIRTGETHPDWYLVLKIFDNSPQVAGAAYRALKGVSTKPTTDPVAAKMWPQFPSATDADLTPQGLKGLQERVKVWWRAWLAERHAESK